MTETWSKSDVAALLATLATIIYTGAIIVSEWLEQLDGAEIEVVNGVIL